MGTLANLSVYLTTVFNMKSIQTTAFLSTFQGTTNLATLVGAFLSDTYFGRYKTLGFASIVSFLVLVFNGHFTNCRIHTFLCTISNVLVLLFVE